MRSYDDVVCPVLTATPNRFLGDIGPRSRIRYGRPRPRLHSGYSALDNRNHNKYGRACVIPVIKVPPPLPHTHLCDIFVCNYIFSRDEGSKILGVLHIMYGVRDVYAGGSYLCRTKKCQIFYASNTLCDVLKIITRVYRNPLRRPFRIDYWYCHCSRRHARERENLQFDNNR